MTNIKCPKYICIVARTCIAMLYLYCCSFYSKNILRRIMHNNSTQYTLPFFFIINTVPRCWSRAQMWFGFVVCVFETILFPCASHCLSRTQLILVLLVFFSSGSATFDGDNTAVWVGWEKKRGRLDSRALGHTLLSIDICCDDLGGDFFFQIILTVETCRKQGIFIAWDDANVGSLSGDGSHRFSLSF